MKNFSFWIITLMALFRSDLIFAQNIVINEILSSNISSIEDEDGSHQDWIELYNNGSSSVNLNGYGLSDDSSLPLKWRFPNFSLGAGKYLIVWASDKNRAVTGSPFHTNFKISAAGNNILISDPTGKVINNIPPVNLQPNISYGRFPNGTGLFTFFPEPTPNSANNTTSYDEILSPPVFSQESAFLTSDFLLTISSPDAGTSIIYTLDGSEPDEKNQKGTTYSYKKSYPELEGQPFGAFFQNSFKTLPYTNPITITDRTSQTNKLSNISTTWDFSPPYFPNGPIFKATVVKAKAIKTGAYPSKTVTKNYFISPKGKDRFTIPVVSISLNENDFFDYYNGIYVAGVDFDNWRTENPTEEADEDLGNFSRFGPLSEKIADLSYFINGQEVINQTVGVRIQGNHSRTYPSKSIRIYARSTLGNGNLDYPFFSDEPYNSYERVVVKNYGSDFYRTMLKDPLCHELVKSLQMETEAHKQVVTFINGEYWGILALREQYDNNYFKLVYDIPSDQIELLEKRNTVKEGDDIDYENFFDYISKNDLSVEQNYSYIKTRMDTDNFIDYFISNIYLYNDDWPSNNIIYWRKKTSSYQPDAPYGHDGRWRWAYHDVTSTFSDFTFDSLARATTTDSSVLSLWSTLILRKLLENKTFKTEFINRFADLINTSFLPSRINKKIDEMTAVLAPEMKDQYFRWKAIDDDDSWQHYIDRLKNFANQRPEYQRNHIRTKFQIKPNINATLGVSDASAGFIKMNTIDIKEGTDGITSNPYPWTGVYFSGIPVKIKAIANSGYTFSHWTGDYSGTNPELIITPTSSFTVTAAFVPETVATSHPIYYWFVNSKVPDNYPLQTVNTTYKIGSTDGVLQYQSCLAGYPFNELDTAHWRKASMERRNNPSDINYIPELNDNLSFMNSDMKGLQIKEPLQNGNLENTLIFNLSTSGYKHIKFAFAAINELTNANAIVVDYSVNSGNPVWISSGLPSNTFSLELVYKLFNIDFTSITAANNNPNFKVRLQFTGSNLTADSGARITFNNIVVYGTSLNLSMDENSAPKFLIYPNPVKAILNISSQYHLIDYKILSINGKIIQKGILDSKEINLSQLPSGLYLLQLNADGKSEIEKIIKN